MKIAVIGSGISGLTAAYLLSRRYEVTVFESDARLGGHTHTHDMTVDDGNFAVDSGFIVYNERNYPNFVRLLEELQVPTQPSSMSFSVQNARSGVEYNGTSLNTLFAQRRNLFRPAFHRMIRDILRFNRAGRAFAEHPDAALTFGAFLDRGGYSRELREDYIIPMGAAIWSADPKTLLEFPAQFFLRFFNHHGMLSVDDRPPWRVIRGGSREYVKCLIQPFCERIRLSTPVERIRRGADHVQVATPGGEERFDHCVVAVHSDQALRLLADANDVEKQVLGAIPYQRNLTLLHTDTQVMPRSSRAWASWNYHLPLQAKAAAGVTYYMNMLQSLRSQSRFFVTLNRSEAVTPAKILKQMEYHHPVYTTAAVAAQARWREISGVRRTHFCGAYWGYGFHEDGVKSALRVCEALGVPWP